MHTPPVVHRLASLGAARRTVDERLRRAWRWSDERCNELHRFTEEVYLTYSDFWWGDWRWRARALLLAPVVLVALAALVALLLAGRLLSVTVAAVVGLVLAAAAAAPLIGVAWALSSLVPGDTDTAPAAASGPCHPSYPAWCIMEEPDLDCPLGAGNPPYAPVSNLAVRGADPHNLDSDNDGIGCEG
jgi:hypothetical protein